MKRFLTIGLILLGISTGCARKPAKANPNLEIIVPKESITSDLVWSQCANEQITSCHRLKFDHEKGSEQIRVKP